MEPRIVHTPMDPYTASWNVPYAGKCNKAYLFFKEPTQFDWSLVLFFFKCYFINFGSDLHYLSSTTFGTDSSCFSRNLRCIICYLLDMLLNLCLGVTVPGLTSGLSQVFRIQSSNTNQSLYSISIFFTNKPILIDFILCLYSAFFKNLKCSTDIISN